MSESTAAGAISVNGEVFAPGAACVPAMDHGFLFGDSVYEVVRTYGGRPVAMQPHLERMRASGEQIYFEVPWSDAEIRRIARRTVEATELPEVYVRIVVTRGPGPMSLLPDGCGKATLLVYAFPLRVPGPEVLRDGIAIVVPDRIRNDPGALAPSAKTGNYLNNLLALVEARRQGGADAVMVGADGHVTEATTANVWWVRNGVVFTPSLESGILPGITRSMLIPAVVDAGFDVREGRFPVEDLLGADEVFLTGTVRGVTPVVTIGGQPVGDGRPGPITARLVGLNERVMADNAKDW